MIRSSSGASRISSRRVPELLTSTAGKIRRFGELTVELELHVAGALELLEDHLVHPRAGLDQRGREDGERATVLDVAGGAEELLRRVERGGVDTTGQDAAARRGREVVGPPRR
jgi:hypothetical protein